MIICRVCARRFFQFPVMVANNKKWRPASWFTMLNSLFSFPTFLLFSPFRLVRSNTWGQWKHLTPERSIDLCLQTFPKLLLLLVPKVTTHSLYPTCIANLKLPIDAFYRESRSGVNIAKRNITTGLLGLPHIDSFFYKIFLVLATKIYTIVFWLDWIFRYQHLKQINELDVLTLTEHIPEGNTNHSVNEKHFILFFVN